MNIQNIFSNIAFVIRHPVQAAGKLFNRIVALATGGPRRADAIPDAPVEDPVDIAQRHIEGLPEEKQELGRELVAEINDAQKTKAQALQLLADPKTWRQLAPMIIPMLDVHSVIDLVHEVKETTDRNNPKDKRLDRLVQTVRQNFIHRMQDRDYRNSTILQILSGKFPENELCTLYDLLENDSLFCTAIQCCSLIHLNMQNQSELLKSLESNHPNSQILKDIKFGHCIHDFTNASKKLAISDYVATHNLTPESYTRLVKLALGHLSRLPSFPTRTLRDPKTSLLFDPKLLTPESSKYLTDFILSNDHFHYADSNDQMVLDKVYTIILVLNKEKLLDPSTAALLVQKVLDQAGISEGTGDINNPTLVGYLSECRNQGFTQELSNASNEQLNEFLERAEKK